MPRHDLRPMSEARRGSDPRVVVVGGGVIGLSCAYYLARAGADVVVLERHHVGAGASSGNAGTVSAGHPPLNRPGRVGAALRQMADPTSPLYVKPRWDPALWRWLLGFARHCTASHVEHAMGIMAPLGKEALSLFETLIDEERLECGYRPDGYFDVCRTEKGLAAARDEADIIRRYGYHPEVVDGDELRRREPHFSRDLLGGVYYPEAATLEPARFLEGLAAAVGRRGAQIREGVRVVSVQTTGGRVRGVKAVTGNRGVTGAGGSRAGGSGADGRGPRSGDGAEELIPADAVVLATGPFSKELARQVGARLPVQPGKGYHRDVQIGPNGAPPLRVACVLHESSVFCTPMDTVVRLAGTMEFSGMNHVMRPARLRQLTLAARRAFPDLGTARPVSEWVGLRPMSMDGLPIVGPLGGVEGLTVATGHGMLGLTLGPVTGQIIAKLVMEGGDQRASGLSPARFD